MDKHVEEEEVETSLIESKSLSSSAVNIAYGALIRLKQIMLCVARIIVFLTCALLILSIPFMSWELYERGKEPLIIAWYSAGAFAILAVLVSVAGIVNHLTHYDRPDLQRYIVRILWMVPIYAIESWIALRFKEYHVHLQIFREAYESFVIYSFINFLIAYMGKNEDVLIQKLELRQEVPHVWPLSMVLKPWAMGRRFLLECKWGTLQYVLIMNLCSVLVWIMEELDLYGEGVLSWSKGYVYITAIKSYSQGWALYCLVLFYRGCKDLLLPVRPLGKFLCVKAVIFFSFWQSIAIVFMVSQGWIPSHQDWTIENVASGLQDFLICVEMFIAAIAHHWVFPYTDFSVFESNRDSFIKSFLHSTIPSDLYQEVRIMNRRGRYKSEDIELLSPKSSSSLTVQASTMNIASTESVIHNKS